MAFMGTEISYDKAEIESSIKTVILLCYSPTLWNYANIRRQKYSEIILYHGQFVQHKSDMVCSGIGQSSLWRKADDYLPEP